METLSNYTVENYKEPQLLELDQAEGSVGAEVYSTEQDEYVRLIAERQYHTYTDEIIVCKCIDGRNCKVNPLVGPNSAGGTFSLLVADDLTSKRFSESSDVPLEQGMKTLTQHMVSRGSAVGMHVGMAQHEHDVETGCGANDKVEIIYAMLVKKAEHIRSLAEAILGRDIDNTIHNMILGNATERVVFGTGKKVHDAFVTETAHDDSEALEGEHHEIIVMINKRPNTTLDRDALEADAGKNIQAFNSDVWSFRESAKAIAKDELDEADIDAKEVAMLYYNLATALVLCRNNMKVVISE